MLSGGRVVGQTVHPDVTGPPPHPALQRLIDIRAADSSFVLDQLRRSPNRSRSPLAGHLDLRHVGIVGHSIGGATAVQAMACDRRFKVGVNLDGKLFGASPARGLTSRSCGSSPAPHPDRRVHATDETASSAASWRRGLW